MTSQEDEGREGPPSLPEGAIPAPAPAKLPPIQRIPRPRCPYCDARNVRMDGAHNGVRYYRCRVCASVETGDWSRFKVLVED